MLININDLKTIYCDYDFSKYTDERLKRKLESIEHNIIEYTGNHFYNNNIKTECTLENGVLYGDFKGFLDGDTVELYNASINSGLYTISSKLSDSSVILDSVMNDYDKPMNMIKIEYPIAIIEGCVELLNYDLNVKNISKLGVSSESISRHSVSYVQRNDSNMSMGYPSELLNFLKPYMEWRT